MSFTIPFNYPSREMELNYGCDLTSLSEKDQIDLEKYQIFERQRKELENIAAKQKERIRELRTNTAIEIESYVGKRTAQINYEKEQLLSEIAQKTSFIKESNVRLREERWMTEEEIQWRETRLNLAHAMGDLTDLQAEIKDSKKQLEVLESLGTHQREKAQTVHKELQQARDQVKWLLECQVVDELVLKERVQEEEIYLQQLVEVRDNMQKEMHQLSRQEEFEILPLKEEVDTLEVYVQEMQNITQKLEIQCEGLRAQTDEAQRTKANASEESFDPWGERNCIEDVDQDLIDMLTEEIFTARKKGVVLISVEEQKEQWLQNYYTAWGRIEKRCEELLHNTKADAETRIVETRRRVQLLQHRLDEVTGRHSGEALERRTALLAMENLMHLMRDRHRSESVMMQQIDEMVDQLGVQAEPYMSLIKMEGYDDILNEYDDGAGIQIEASASVFDALLEESPEEAVNKITSMVEVAPVDDSGVERLRRPAHRNSRDLQEFVQQKALFLSELASRGHLPLRRTNSKGSPPESVEDALSQIQERIVNEVVSFVKTRKQKVNQGQVDPLQESVVPDPDYLREAQETQARIELLTEILSATPVVNDESHAPCLQDSVISYPFRPISVECAHIPSHVLAASPFVQAKYFLSFAIRGFTTVMLTSENNVPCVRHLFLSRDMNRLCARDMGKLDSESDSRDVFVMVENIVDVVLKTDTPLTNWKLEGEFSFVIVVEVKGNSEFCWIVQTDSNESRDFWAYVLSWVANETAPKNKDAIITHLKEENKVFVLDSGGSTAEYIEPSERGTLHVQVCQG